MPRFFTWPLTVGVIALVAASPGVAHATRYTLPELLRRVDTAAPQLDVAREQQAIAEAQAHQAWRLALPTGDLTFGLTGAPEVRCADASGFSDPSQKIREQNCVQTNVADLKNNSSLADALPIKGVGLRLDIRLVQPLYTFGKIGSAKEAAAAGVSAAKSGIEAARADVKAQAIRAYFGLKWARATTATLDDTIGKLRGWVDKIDSELDKGKSKYSQTDLLRLKLAVEQVELVRLEAVRAGEIALAGLRLLTDDKTADIDDAELELPDDPQKPIDFYEQAAELARPESRMLAAAVQAARAGRKLRLAELLPDFGLAGSFSYGYASSVDDPQNAFFNRPNTLGFGLALVVKQPLDLGVRIGRLEQAKAEERAVIAKRRLALGGIALEIDRAFADAKEARARSEHTARGERIARSWLTTVDQSLSLGVGEPKDLVDAARGYIEMRLRNLQSILDVYTTLAQLERTSGVKRE